MTIRYGDKMLSRWISDEAPDPHAPDTRWRYDAKWGLQWNGEGHGQLHYGWTTDLSSFVSTPERVSLWYRLMRQTQGEPK